MKSLNSLSELIITNFEPKDSHIIFVKALFYILSPWFEIHCFFGEDTKPKNNWLKIKNWNQKLLLRLKRLTVFDLII
jgi:hypothetical protein